MSLHYVIDGYNLIKQTPRLTKKRLKDSRVGLVRFIKEKRPQGSKKNLVTIVFDGAPDMPVRSSGTDIKVIFTKNESADDWIKRSVENTKNPKQIVVVSNDKQIRFYVRSLGAKILSVEEFIAEKQKFGLPDEPSQSKIELSSQQAQQITEELRKIWLK